MSKRAKRWSSVSWWGTYFDVFFTLPILTKCPATVLWCTPRSSANVFVSGFAPTALLKSSSTSVDLRPRPRPPKEQEKTSRTVCVAFSETEWFRLKKLIHLYIPRSGDQLCDILTLTPRLLTWVRMLGLGPIAEEYIKGQGYPARHISWEETTFTNSRTWKLWHKLPCLGLHSAWIRWLSDFLNNRVFQVRIELLFPSVRKVTRGIPQGECYLRFFFALHTADLPCILECYGVVYKQFADDLKSYRKLVGLGNRSFDPVRLKQDLRKVWSLEVAKCRWENHIYKALRIKLTMQLQTRWSLFKQGWLCEGLRLSLWQIYQIMIILTWMLISNFFTTKLQPTRNTRTLRVCQGVVEGFN